MHLDKLLEGGLREGTVTELVGGSSSGKTQVCMQVAASVAYRCRAMVGFVDTCHSFSATRLSHMLGGLVGGRDAVQRRVGAADEIGDAMKSIMHYSIFDIFPMLSFLNQLHTTLSVQVQSMEEKVMRLLIVDCASSVISPILGGIPGHALMVSMGIILKKLALENHLAVLHATRSQIIQLVEKEAILSLLLERLGKPCLVFACFSHETSAAIFVMLPL